jgi:hypothetical protein
VDAVVDLVAVESGLASNCGEFAVIKIRVEHGFPDAEKLDGVPVAEPVGDEKLPVLRFEHVGERDVIAVLDIALPSPRSGSTGRFCPFCPFCPFFAFILRSSFWIQSAIPVGNRISKSAGGRPWEEEERQFWMMDFEF